MCFTGARKQKKRLRCRSAVPALSACSVIGLLRRPTPSVCPSVCSVCSVGLLCRLTLSVGPSVCSVGLLRARCGFSLFLSTQLNSMAHLACSEFSRFVSRPQSASVLRPSHTATVLLLSSCHGRSWPRLVSLRTQLRLGSSFFCRLAGCHHGLWPIFSALWPNLLFLALWPFSFSWLSGPSPWLSGSSCTQALIDWPFHACTGHGTLHSSEIHPTGTGSTPLQRPSQNEARRPGMGKAYQKDGFAKRGRGFTSQPLTCPC